MTTREVEDFFRSQWASVSKLCVDNQEPGDRRTMKIFRTFEDIQKYVIDEPETDASQRAIQEIKMVQPRLLDLEKYTQLLTSRLGPDFNPAVFWGVLGLLLTVISPFDNASQHVTQMVKKLSSKIQLAQLYSGLSSEARKEEQEIFFEMFLHMTRFFADAVLFLRTAGDIANIATPSSHDPNSWQPLLDIFNRVEGDLDDALSRLDKFATIRRNQDTASLFSYLSIAPPAFHNAAQLPCFVLPPARGARFFDRDDVIAKIEAQFDAAGPNSFYSLALYGMGGVGKSHVALKYAEKRQLNREVDAILWVESETTVNMDNSFTNIALRLKLPEARQNTQLENRILVKEWLQQTDCKWLLIYDNVENFDILKDYWILPGSKGRALITTRNHSLAFEPADGGIEVLSWDTETGSKFLLHILSGHISADLLTSESKSAYELSQRLSGHALALSNMCGLIHRRSWTITELVEVYDRSSEFKDGLEVVWSLSFRNLRPDSAALLSIFAFCAPDSIPQALFDVDSKVVLPQSLRWFQDEERLSEAIEDLLTLALIKRDRQSRQFSIHRLVQTHYKRFLGAEDRQKAFCDASIMLYNVFPKRSQALYDQWEQCQRWLPQVLNLRDTFRRERQRDSSFHACFETCQLWTSCQRYLLEQNAWVDLEDLITNNKAALGTLEAQDPDLWMLSATESHSGQMYSRQGRFRIALGSLLTTCDIKLAAQRVDLITLTWAQENVAINYNCTLELEAAIEWYETTAATWRRHANEKGIDPKLPVNLRVTNGRILAYQRKFREAETVLNDVLEDLLAGSPLNFGYAAFCKFSIGRLHMFEQDFLSAERDFMEAQNLWLRGDQSRISDFNGAALYRIGCCALLQGDLDAALKNVQDATFVTAMRKDIMVGEHARALFKLSEILYQIPGREEEAEKSLQEAEQLYRRRVGMPELAAGSDKTETGTSTAGISEDDYDALVFIFWR